MMHLWVQFKERREQKKWKLAFAYFQKEIDDPSSKLSAMFKMNVNRQATLLVMNQLDKMKITHCRYCHATGPLRKHNDAYLCEPHFKTITEKQVKVPA